MSAILFKKLSPAAVIPTKGTDGSAGLDVTYISLVDDSVRFPRLRTGLAVQPPDGYYFELHGRSSLYKSGYMLANNVGVIDGDYRGEIIIVLTPINGVAYELPPVGSRVAQLVLKKNELANVEVAEILELDDTGRGVGGFGSTGV